MKRTLVLGGTTEASALVAELARQGLPAVLSYAGRVDQPRAQPVPVRVGGFGGVAGLAEYLRAENIGQIVDATHPFAARISANAVEAAALSGVPLRAFERPAWQPQPGDSWQEVADISGAVQALQRPAARVFLAIGRLHLAAFAHLSQHDFLLRVVDVPQADFPLPRARIEVARGPFSLADDLALMRGHRTEILVAKNAGGAGAQAKIDAARQLGLEVVMIARPAVPARQVIGGLHGVMAWLHTRLGV
ncbi:cobalt-precorrin-6A reductase [Falsigemmobacter faecalis]|uniref:Cobalt-precorrin-6A reductase n=1 Tax=Falsigemmobacter faecalis TaxID=2488730 RepID=A0A3P3DEY2_9RHOB|nr:cobalt-precorrin-6A reductase [Falsigemmobacter faecalis]RRH72062.1 cobalt-precorrin-6A reductase [Falsigemmobacter faecalis]